MLTVEHAQNLRWANQENDYFDCEVKFKEFAEVMPFTCNVADPIAHSVDLWTRAHGGEFGDIQPYTEPEQIATEPQPDVSGAQTL